MPHVFTIDGARGFGAEVPMRDVVRPPVEVPIVEVGTDPSVVLPRPEDADSLSEWWKRNHDIAAGRYEQCKQERTTATRQRWFFLAGGFIAGLLGGLLAGRLAR